MKTIFVSSTFKDMQDERDLLHTKIIPSVNYALKEKGDYANFLDFRWGIDTKGLPEDLALKKVLSACFDAIKNSDFFIVFIGNSYGSCVPQFIIEELEKQHQFIHDCYNKSITELEIDCASYNGIINFNNVLFYIRESNDVCLDKRVENLRTRIKNIYPEQIRNYCELDDKFTEQLIKDVLLWFNKSVSRKDNLSRQITLDNLVHFSSRKELLNDTIKYVTENSITVVHGESGCGKSVFMSALADGLSKKFHTNIHYVNRSFYYNQNILLKLWSFLEKTVHHYFPKHKLNHDCFEPDYEKQIFALCSIINETTEIKDLVFLIDGIDKLNSTQVSKLLLSLKHYSPKLHFVISLDNPDKYVYMQEPCCVFLGRLSDEDRKQVINKELEINHKALPEEIIEILLSKKDSGLPLYLVLSVKRLVHMQKEDYTNIYQNGDFSESISNHITDVFNGYSDDIENMIIDYIEFAERIIDKKEAINIVSFLAASSYGFTETELYFLIEKYHMDYSPVLFFESSNPFKYKEFESFRDNSPLRNLAGSPLYADFNVAEFYLFYKYLGDLLSVNNYNGKLFFDNAIVKKAIFDLYHGEIILDAISNEIFYAEKDRVLPDNEICNCVLRTTFVKSYIVDPYAKQLFKRYFYPPFYLINEFIKSEQEKQIRMLATALFDLLVFYGASLLKSYLSQVSSLQKKQLVDKESSLNSIRFLMKYVFPKISLSMLNPIEYVPIFQDCLSFLKKHMDYTILDNRLYIIMSQLNLAIMCFNANFYEEAYTIAKQCKAQLNAVPIVMRNELFDEAVETLSAKIQEWRMIK